MTNDKKIWETSGTVQNKDKEIQKFKRINIKEEKAHKLKVNNQEDEVSMKERQLRQLHNEIENTETYNRSCIIQRKKHGIKENTNINQMLRMSSITWRTM